MGHSLQLLDDYWGDENSDPKLIADVVVQLSRLQGLPPHLLLGRDAVNYLQQVDDERASLAHKWRSVSISVDFKRGDSTGAPSQPSEGRIRGQALELEAGVGLISDKIRQRRASAHGRTRGSVMA